MQTIYIAILVMSCRLMLFWWTHRALAKVTKWREFCLTTCLKLWHLSTLSTRRIPGEFKKTGYIILAFTVVANSFDKVRPHECNVFSTPVVVFGQITLLLWWKAIKCSYSGYVFISSISSRINLGPSRLVVYPHPGHSLSCPMPWF